MTWEEYQKKQFLILQKEQKGYEPTMITCPNCGNFIYKDTSVVLTSNPPQYNYKCSNCEWRGHGF